MAAKLEEIIWLSKQKPCEKGIFWDLFLWVSYPANGGLL